MLEGQVVDGMSVSIFFVGDSSRQLCFEEPEVTTRKKIRSVRTMLSTTVSGGARHAGNLVDVHDASDSPLKCNHVLVSPCAALTEIVHNLCPT